MKKMTKRMLLLALVFAIAGAAFGIVSVCAGFELSEFQAACESGAFQFIGPAHWRADMKKFVSDIRSGNTETDWTYRDVDSLELDIGTAECTIIPVDTQEWRVIGTHLPERFRCEQKNGTLKVTCEKGFWEFLNIFSLGRDNAEIEIWVPSSRTVDKIQIDAGVGDVSMPQGAVRCKKMEVDGGVGDIQLCVDITKKLEIDGGVGDTEVELTGRQTDFDYDIDNGVGEIVIGDSSYSNLGSEFRLDNHTGKEITIDNGVGDVRVSFTED